MGLINWQENFSVGVPSVDHEHRELIDLINRVYEELVAGADVEGVIQGLGEVFAKISAHFALEEKVMIEQGYDQYLQHKSDHEDLLDDIRDIMDDCETTGRLDEQMLADRLRSWFVTHFRDQDARLHNLLGV